MLPGNVIVSAGVQLQDGEKLYVLINGTAEELHGY